MAPPLQRTEMQDSAKRALSFNAPESFLAQIWANKGYYFENSVLRCSSCEFIFPCPLPCDKELEQKHKAFSPNCTRPVEAFPRTSEFYQSTVDSVPPTPCDFVVM